MRGGCWDAGAAIEEIAAVVAGYLAGRTPPREALRQIERALWDNNFGDLLEGLEGEAREVAVMHKTETEIEAVVEMLLREEMERILARKEEVRALMELLAERVAQVNLARVNDDLYAAVALGAEGMAGYGQGGTPLEALYALAEDLGLGMEAEEAEEVEE